MEDVVQAILQVGVAPALAGYILFDHSRKLQAMQESQIKLLLTQVEQKEDLEKIAQILEKMREECKK